MMQVSMIIWLLFLSTFKFPKNSLFSCTRLALVIIVENVLF